MSLEKEDVGRSEWLESIKYGRARCQEPECDGVDLSDVDSVSEAIAKWNRHVEERHWNA